MPSIYATAPPTTILATSLPSPAPTIPPVPIPTSQPVPAPTTVSLTLLACDFDASLCGFSNTGNYEWTRISGSTPSSNTGPSGDATSGSGSYVYVEATWPNSPNKGPFALTSPPFSACVGSVQFSYHMLGFSMGVLELEEMTNGIWTMIWSKTGNQGDGWRAATVTTSAFVSQVRFVGTTGMSFSGDMSIDDVTIFSGSGCILPSPVPSVTRPPTAAPSLPPSAMPSVIPFTQPTLSMPPTALPTTPRPTPAMLLMCDFDSSAAACGFHNSGDYPWTLNSGSTYSSLTGPSADHTTGSGNYMYAEASAPNFPNKGPFLLTTPVFTDCVGNASFFYHMYGATIGSLTLRETTDRLNWATLWTKAGNQGDNWQ